MKSREFPLSLLGFSVGGTALLVKAALHRLHLAVGSFHHLVPLRTRNVPWLSAAL